MDAKVDEHKSFGPILMAALGLAVGCGGSDTAAVVTDGGGGGAEASTPDAASASDGAATDGSQLPDGSRAAFCMGTGSPVVVGDSSSAERRCTGRIAERRFRYGLCSCSDVSVSDELITDGFDSRSGSPGDGGGGSPVGVNRRFNTSGGVDVGGTFTVAGSENLQVTGDHRVRGDLQTNGTLGVTGTLEVERDARVAQNVDVNGDLRVGRDLVQPEGATRSGDIVVDGETRTEAVSVDEPCACGEDELLDVESTVAWGRDHNHNAEVDELEATSLANVRGDRTVDLPCGRFYLTRIDASSELVLNVQGRTALFVGGNVSVSGSLDVQLAPDAELDVFIAGNLGATGSASFGSPDRPAAVRVYVGGEGTVEITGESDFVGNLYAPEASVETTGTAEVFGSIFAGEFQSTGSTTIHYDRAVLDAGEACEMPPPDTCSVCGDCTGGETCIEGTCTSCESDADCCEPHVCNDGMCGPLVI